MRSTEYQLTKKERLSLSVQRLCFRREFIVVELGLLLGTFLIWFYSDRFTTAAKTAAIIFPFLSLFIPLVVVITLVKIVSGPPIEKTTFSFDDSAAHFSTPGQKVELLWTNFHGLTETSSYIFLHIGQSERIPIPKRAFTSSDIDLLRSYAGK